MKRLLREKMLPHAIPAVILISITIAVYSNTKGHSCVTR